MKKKILMGCLWVLSAASYAQENDRVRSGNELRWSMNGSVEVMPKGLSTYYGTTDSNAIVNRNSRPVSTALGGNLNATRFESVKAQCDGNAVLFNWTAVQQFGADRYEIEQSANGRNWTVVGVMPANRTDFGNASYSFNYNRNVKDAVFRITAISNSGERLHSSQVSSPCSNATYFAVTQNPVYSTTSVRIGSPSAARVKIILFSSSGVMLQTREVGLLPGTNDIPVNMSNLANGMYTLAIFWQNGKQETLSLVKQ